MATVIIPARFGSTRLPGKPLLAETGKPLILHVIDSVATAWTIDRIVVATDDERIAQVVRDYGDEAILTSADCRTGTDRLAETAEMIGLTDDEIIINVQGDEPQMPGWCVDRVADLLEHSQAHIATLATEITPEQAEDPRWTKVVFAKDGSALYFSRARIPHDRDNEGRAPYYLHHGIYAYRVGFLKTFSELPSTPAEQAEKLEQLRALEYGYRIIVDAVEYRGARIDTPQEYQQFVQHMKTKE